MTYQVLGFQTYNTEQGCDAERMAYTIREAKREASYMLSDEYRRASEASANLAVVQIWKDSELVDEIRG